MVRIVNWTVGFIVGAALGGVVALLMTPRSGSELQSELQGRLQSIQAAGQQAAADRRVELGARFEALKQPKPRA